MANTGLQEVMQAAFASVPNMLVGKKFPYNVRALRMVVEEILRPLLMKEDIQSFEHLMYILEQRAGQSRTASLWLDALIKPVFIMMLFVRAEREGEWPLHLLATERMLPYFAAAGHWNYFRYGTVYLMKMTKMPTGLLNHFLGKQHVMRHRSGLWNAIWSDMMIETTMMRYGHGPGGIIGFTLNEKALERWALGVHVRGQLQKDLFELDDNYVKNEATVHKEERPTRIKSDGEDRRNICDKLSSCISPINPEEHSEQLVNIVSGKLANDAVNVDKAHEIGRKQVETFKENLPESFYAKLSKQVTTMLSLKKSIKVDDAEVFDTALIYSRVIALQLSRDSVKLDDVLKYELAPIPTTMFTDSGDIRTAKNKSVLKNKLSIEVSTRQYAVPDTVVIDGSAILWIVNWPTKGSVADFVSNIVQCVLQELARSNVYFVFDRYYDYSIKLATRAERGKAASRAHKLNRETPLPCKSVVLTNIGNKIQLIDIVCEDLIQAVK